MDARELVLGAGALAEEPFGVVATVELAPVVPAVVGAAVVLVGFVGDPAALFPGPAMELCDSVVAAVGATDAADASGAAAADAWVLVATGAGA